MIRILYSCRAAAAELPPGSTAAPPRLECLARARRSLSLRILRTVLPTSIPSFDFSAFSLKKGFFFLTQFFNLKLPWWFFNFSKNF